MNDLIVGFGLVLVFEGFLWAAFPRRRMFLETMERVLGGTDKIILDGKAGSGVVPYLPLNELTKSNKSGGN